MELFKTKTFWAGITAIVGAVGGFAQGVLAPPDALQIISTALIGIFLRHGIAKQ